MVLCSQAIGPSAPSAYDATVLPPPGDHDRPHTERAKWQEVRAHHPLVSEPKRDSGVWSHVTVLREHPTVPQVECDFGQHVFSGGTTRIRDHLCDKCSGSSESLMSLKEKLLKERELASKHKSKKWRQAELDLSLSTDVPSTLGPYVPYTPGQLTIQESMLPQRLLNQWPYCLPK